MAKQKDLFGNEVKYFDLFAPKDIDINAARQILNHKYDKEALMQIYKAFRQWTADYSLRLVNDKGKTVRQDIIRNLETKKIYKDTYAEFLGVVMADERNLKKYFSLMPEKSRMFLITVMKEGCLSIEDAQEQGHIAESIDDFYYYTSPVLTKEFAWLSLTNFGYYYSYRSLKGFYVYLYPAVIRYFVPVLMPEALAAPQKRTSLPDDKQWNICNFEQEAFRDVPLIENMFEQDIITTGSNKLMVASTEKKVDQLGIADFTHLPTVGNTRARLLSSCIAMMREEGDNDFDADSVPVEKQAFALLRSHLQEPGLWLQVCTPFVKGISRRSIAERCNANAIIRYIVNALYSFRDAGWIAVDDIIEHMYANLMFPRNATFAFEPDRDNMDNLPENTFRQITLQPDCIVNYLTKPFIRGFLLLLGAWGMLETATQADAHEFYSPFDSLQYVKLTSLGKYALSIEKNYNPPKVEEKVWFDVDDNRLIFRSLSPNNPYNVIMNDMANSIGAGRYEVTSESFLSHCSTRGDVEQKIAIFTQYIGRDLPPLWKDFFDEMLRHCQPLEKLSISNYKMFRVDKSNTTLQRLLTTDDKLRSMVIRAEGFRILVSKSDLPKFERQLKVLGYLL